MHYIYSILFCFIALSGFAQNTSTKQYSKKQMKENLVVEALYTDAATSSFSIHIRDAVPLHQHEWHTEQIWVLQGKAIMTLGDKTFPIRKGDYVIIPMQMAHAVKVTSRKPLQVISIQAPEFKGEDRIWL